MKKSALFTLALLSACAGSNPVATQVATLENISFEVPADWISSPNPAAMTHAQSVVWVPPTNAAKESLTVIRAPGAAQRFKKEGSLAQVLLGAQRALASAHASRPLPVKLGRLQGLKLSVDFVPSGTASPYRRMHVVLVDHEDLIHVLYTTKNWTGDLAVFDTALNSLRSTEEGA